MINIEWKTRGCVRWKCTAAFVSADRDQFPRALIVRLRDRVVMDRAHNAVWRIGDRVYETRSTDGIAGKVHVSEVE